MICKIIADIAGTVFTETDANNKLLGKNAWPEITEFTFKLCLRQEEVFIKTGLQIFDSLFELVSKFFEEYIQQFYQIFKKSLESKSV